MTVWVDSSAACVSGPCARRGVTEERPAKPKVAVLSSLSIPESRRRDKLRVRRYRQPGSAGWSRSIPTRRPGPPWWSTRRRRRLGSALSARCRAALLISTAGSRSEEAAQAGLRLVAVSQTAYPGQVSPSCSTDARRRSLSRMSPLRWNIAARSAFIAGAVVFVALALAGAALTVALHQALLSGVDDAAARRVGD